MPTFHTTILRSRSLRWCTLAGFGAAMMAILTAQDQLSSPTLSSWDATGAAPVAAQAQGAITLPAGSQMARSYPSGQLVVHLVSRPFFGTTADNWPALEVGPAALAFVRIDAEGGIVLLADKALPLPSAIALGSDGRSLQPLDLTLSYDASHNAATLVLDGASYTASATTLSTQLQVAVSAGSSVDWTLSLLEVRSSPYSAGTDASAEASGASSSASASPSGAASAPVAVASSETIDLVARKRAFQNAVSLAATGDLLGSEAALAGRCHFPASTTGRELELAGALVQVAYRLKEIGKLENSAKVAGLVLQHVDRCVSQASSAETEFAGSALELAGLVDTMFFGDLKASEAAYRKALIVSPGLLSAQSALSQLLAARAAEQKKLQASGSK